MGLKICFVGLTRSSVCHSGLDTACSSPIQHLRRIAYLLCPAAFRDLAVIFNVKSSDQCSKNGIHAMYVINFSTGDRPQSRKAILKPSSLMERLD